MRGRGLIATLLTVLIAAVGVAAFLRSVKKSAPPFEQAGPRPMPPVRSVELEPTAATPSVPATTASRGGGQRFAASALLTLGVILLLAGAGTIAFAELGALQHQLTQTDRPGDALPERLDDAGAQPLLDEAEAAQPEAVAPTQPPTASPTPAATATAPPPPAAVSVASTTTALPTATASPSPTALPTASPTPLPPSPTPTPPPSYGPAVWMNIPRIDVDSSVMEVTAEGGFYVVPSYDVGHHDESLNPGESGNSVFNGHLETINAGKIFARLSELEPGDAIYVYTETHRLSWKVREVKIYPAEDSSFIDATEDRRITLYTCHGTLFHVEGTVWDYTERIAVIGDLVEVAPRTE